MTTIDTENRREIARLPARPISLEDRYDPPANFLEIEVLNPETHGFAGKRYTDYEVRMKTNLPVFRLKECSVRRRYSDFEWLRKELERDSKIVVPPLPSKAWKRQVPAFLRRDDGIFEDEFIDERRKGLEQFVNKVAGHPLAQNERSLHVFLQDAAIDHDKYVPGKMSAGVPLTARTLAHSHQNDLQRIANPHLEVNERRLRPIYDYMEIHNYRKALTEIDRLLKKQANFTACKALKCLVLLKLERHEDARALANELDALASATTRTAPPGDPSNIDENALTFFSQYYKDLRQYDKVVWLYEAATKRDPTSEECLCSLFMAYVRVKDYKNQVLTAQKLYKLTRKSPYYNWAVISVLLQIDENSNQLKQTLYIPMATKMLEKEFFDENQQQAKLYGEMECLLYLHSIELKEDFPKVLTFLEKHLDALTKSPSNESMLPAYFSHDRLLIYNFKSGNFDNAYCLAKQFLTEDGYLWNWYEVLFDSFFKLDSTKQEELAKDLHEFILTVPTEASDLRSIHLARIELGLRWQLAKLKNTSIALPSLASSYLSDSFLKEIISYIETYSVKTTSLVMFDIYRSLEYLSFEDLTRLHKHLIGQLTLETCQNNAQYLINIFYCARICGDIHSSWLSENYRSLIQHLLDVAIQSSTPSHLSIELLLLIVNIMDETNQSKTELYTLLDRTYEKDATNFDIKLFIYKMAVNFNCVTIMKDTFERLEIKNIQYYSLGYLLTDHYLRIHTNYRQIRYFFNYLTNLLLVYTDDSWSQIMFCYKYGNFLRINEIRAFSDYYLSFSIIYIQSLIGSIIIDLIQNGDRYHSIVGLFKHTSNQGLFEHRDKNNHSLRSLFYKNANSDLFKLQDTRDFDVWSKIDHRRLRFDTVDDNTKSIERISYADRILAENAGQTAYQSPSYKDSFLRQYQTADFQQRTILCYFRANILNLIHTLYIDSTTTSAVRMPDEQVLNALKVILNDFDQSTKSLKHVETITPCEIKSIIDLELYKSIPSFIQILLDGLTFNKSTEATITLANTTVHFDKIDHFITEIIKQLEKSYQLLLQALEKTSFQKRCQTTPENATDDNLCFLNDLSGKQSPLEYYSVYTEFISYIYSLYLSIKSILATLFNKTSLLADSSEHGGNNRSSNTKKSKKKANEQQPAPTVANENENELKLWSQLQKIEPLFNEQWTNITENIQKYETFVRSQGKLTDHECDRLEKDLGGTVEKQSNKQKAKSDETNNNDSSSTATEKNNNDNQSSNSFFELGKSLMSPSTVHTFAISYLESLMQIRICLRSKQKTLGLRPTSA
ncbi:unnamed protein product [Rotaria magnacalcarata]|uniref:Sorting nexin-3 n=1 Tax=Rotaria magnacalcarata TaxID=392030 RepID=A0A816MLU2_9BILA|nr:unnamed protein product [Rotaria magnacalcarata]CAF4084102.1 unnamed protein product [Rotaria magnacalcarata]